ncbi:universal stress protein [Halogeometricum borinquense]|uniref:Universal stress protein UspA-like protein n=2 Tax=Halogeometricum borinquense TaxID=60847 RepID=E4NNJ1_HALBP|nr:universal stress protein [Halogeometricum borinquense]ADQ66345.1 universal stress protein UspA-like protein [Halogeometricum borinquense DSM 11551]ELY27665.1 universal stress protein uspa-like protein [Halogeometricum borinquense DSM 11551]QIB75448.1 universal stress protein [Halogeometricum borinquense]QIQ75715.1 universal stress protein [Halogeometricum borinquense]RYJ14643.1 universal stress protein [Halogeometricum borinquense]
MKQALVVVTPGKRGRRLIREAGEYATGTDTELVLLTIIPEDEFEEKRRAVSEIGSSDAIYTLEQAEGTAEREAMEIADDVLSELNVSYRAVSTVGRKADTILDVAETEGVDHVFLGGRRRSPAGKALFGDVAQKVLLTFEGPVTLLMGDDELGDEDADTAE